MKIGKLEITKNAWYWDNRQLNAPWKILWCFIFIVPMYFFLVLNCLMTAIYYRSWYHAEILWSENCLKLKSRMKNNL